MARPSYRRGAARAAAAAQRAHLDSLEAVAYESALRDLEVRHESLPFSDATDRQPFPEAGATLLPSLASLPRLSPLLPSPGGYRGGIPPVPARPKFRAALQAAHRRARDRDRRRFEETRRTNLNYGPKSLTIKQTLYRIKNPLYGLNVLKEPWPLAIRHCIKRKIRRQVLFAIKGKHIKAKGRGGSYRRTITSQWSC